MKKAHLLVTIVLIFCMLVWLRHTGNINIFIDSSLPAGQKYYLLSKLSALMGLASLVLQVTLILLSRYTNYRWVADWSFYSHRWLGLITFLMLFVHSASFVTAASFRGGSPAFSLLVPNFHSGLYNAAVSIGLIAFYLSIVLVVVGFLSRRNPTKYGRIHRWIVGPLLLCVVVHSVAIGSESKTWPMIAFYVVSCIVLVWLFNRKRRFRTTSG